VTSKPTPEEREVWSIGDLRLDVGQQRLWRGSDELTLPKLSFDLLLALARRAPDVVTYDELMDRVWPGLVVSPETIVQRVRLLRTAIGDDASEPRYVEALRSRGYRLVAPAVRQPDPALPPRPAAPPPASPPPAPPPPAATHTPARGLFVVAALLLASAGAAWFLARDRSATPEPTLAQQDAALEAGAQAQRTVAVLPFENLGTGADADTAQIAQAIPENTLDRLAALHGLTVIARESAQRASRDGRSAREIGQQLGATWLVSGSVQRTGERVRVVARLVDSRADTQVWSSRYERDIDALPALEDELAAGITDALVTRLSGLQRAGQGRGYGANLQATLAYLRGRRLLDRTTIVGADAAAAQFEEAVARDPGFAAAHAALYDARLQAASLRRSGLAEARARHAASLARAFALDPQCAAAFLARARWADAAPAAREADFRRGLDLEPGNVRGIQGYGEFLNTQDRGAEAKRWFERELLVDPLATPALFRRAMATLGPEGAGVERAMLGVLERDPDYYPALQRYAKYRWQLHGELAQGIEIIEHAIATDPENPWGRHLAATIYVDLEDLPAARAVAAGAPVSAASTRTLLALYEGREADAARFALDAATSAFNSAESWGLAEALRDAALRAGAAPGSANERRLEAHFLESPKLNAFTYRVRLMLAQLHLAHAAKTRDPDARAAVEEEIRGIVAWMDANERLSLHHLPRGLAKLLLGDREAALAELAAAFDEDHDYRQWWYTIDHDPSWSPLRDDPRFKAIADRVRAHVQQQRAALEVLRRDGKVPRRGAGLTAPPT